MNNLILRKCLFIFLLVIFLSTFLYSEDDEKEKEKEDKKEEKKDKKYKENKFQIGFGALTSTGNLLGLIESVKLAQSIQDETDYDYPGVTDEQKDALHEINGSMQRAILVANILGSMEYGIHVRILWRIMIAEADLILLPFDGSYNGRLDLMLAPMIGIRCPFFVMPYIMGGVAFTFQIYPQQYSSKESWKGDWAATDHFAFRPGLNLRAGLDLKFPKFSIGAYYQYTIKDFQEFGSWFWHLTNEGISSSEAAGKIFAAQSRFGAVMTFYIPRK